MRRCAKCGVMMADALFRLDSLQCKACDYYRTANIRQLYYFDCDLCTGRTRTGFQVGPWVVCLGCVAEAREAVAEQSRVIWKEKRAAKISLDT